MATAKRYLNKTDKETIYFVAGFVTILEKFIENWEKYKDKTKTKYGKMARTYAKKIMEDYLATLDTQQQAKIIVDSTKFRAYVSYHDDAKEEVKKALALQDNIPVNKVDFLDVAERAIYWCCGCKLRGADVENCRLKQIFVLYDIEVFDQFAPAGICPYRNPGQKELAAV